MGRVLMWMITAAGVLAAFSVCFGYTTLRLPVKPKAGKKRIACVGDSVTYGCTLPLFFLHRYPADLQKMLGREMQVGVFGVNDRTLQYTGNKPFRKEKAFLQSKEFMPDVVVILLGTNDSKDANWNSEESFRKQYRELITEYRQLSSELRILLCTPPYAFKPVNRLFSVTNDAKLDRIPVIAEVIERVAEEENLELVDLYTLTDGKRKLFGPDGLHPSIQGAEEIAGAIYRTILNEQ